MSARTYWSRLFWRKSFRTLPRLRTFRPRLEHLEDRTLLSSAFGPITGTFAGLDEGATFMQDGILFQITYEGGPDGHCVVLTRLA